MYNMQKVYGKGSLITPGVLFLSADREVCVTQFYGLLTLLLLLLQVRSRVRTFSVSLETDGCYFFFFFISHRHARLVHMGLTRACFSYVGGVLSSSPVFPFSPQTGFFCGFAVRRYLIFAVICPRASCRLFIDRVCVCVCVWRIICIMDFARNRAKRGFIIGE